MTTQAEHINKSDLEHSLNAESLDSIEYSEFFAEYNSVDYELEKSDNLMLKNIDTTFEEC